MLQVYNPYLDSVPGRAVSQFNDIAMYNVDRDLPADSDKFDHITRHGGLRLSQRLASESQYERRISRRCARLSTAAHDAFNVIHRMSSNRQGTCSSLRLMLY